MNTRQIEVINHSTRVSDADVAAALPALQKQVSLDFAPIWGADAILSFVRKGLSSVAQIIVLDNADQAGALGYHDLTTADQPIGKVFAETTIQYGGDWHVTFSHELLEMLADPLINMTVLDDKHNRLYALEVCDAVEDDSLGYLIDGIRVSDFVTPAWFDAHAKHGQLFSFKKHVGASYALAPGGYISYLDLSGAGGWQQITHRTLPSRLESESDVERQNYHVLARQHHDSIPRVGSRRERRARGRNRFVRSSINGHD